MCIEFYDQTPTDYDMITNSSFLKTGTILTLLIRSYFGPGFIPRGEGYLDPLTTSLTLSCTNIKFCKVSEIHFKVSENKRLVKNILYSCHGNHKLHGGKIIFILPGLKQGLFQVAHDTLQHSILHLFSPNSPPPPKSQKASKKLKKKFGQISNSKFPHFLPPPCFRAKFQILLSPPPPSGHYQSYISQNLVFRTYAYPNLSRKNHKGLT